MTQNIYTTPMNPLTTSGTEIALLIDGLNDSMMSGFSGTSRPSQVTAGGYWVDTTNDGVGTWDIKVFDGTVDIVTMTINKNTGKASIPGSSDSFEISKISADSVGPIVKLLKSRVANNGQVLNGDTIGQINFTGKDDTGAETIMAQIDSVSTDDVTATEQGSYVSISTSADGTASVTEAVRITGDNKVGVGTVAPEKSVHAVGSGIRSEKNSDDTVGSQLELRKKRVAGSGQVLSGDEIGNVEFFSSDQNGDEIESAKITASATENTTDLANGSKLSIQNKKVGETAYSEALEIADDIDVKRVTTFSDTTSSTDKDTGAVIVEGGLGVEENINTGGTIKVADTTSSTSKDTGSIVTEGGVGIEENLNVGGNTILEGDLTVNGTTTTINTEVLDVEDANITVNHTGNKTSADGNAGITVEMSDETDTAIKYDSTLTSRFKAGDVGSESELIVSSGAQDLSGKSIQSPSRSDVKKDTKSNLETYAATATNGQLVFATDEKKMYQIVDNALSAVGGGVGSLSSYGIAQADDVPYTDFTDGTTNATFGEETTNPLSGSTSYKLTNATGAVGEYVYGPSESVADRSKIKENVMGAMYSYDGADGDMKAIFRDVTNGDDLGEVLLDAGSSVPVYIPGYVADSCDNVQIRIVIEVANDGKELIFDDIFFDDRPFTYAYLPETQEYQIEQGGNALAGVGVTVMFNEATATISNKGASHITPVSGGGVTKFTATRDGVKVDFNASGCPAAANRGIQVALYDSANAFQRNVNGNMVDSASARGSTVSGFYVLNKGESLQISFGSNFAWANALPYYAGADLFKFNFTATASSEHVATPAQSGLESYAIGRYAGYGSINTAIPYFSDSDISENTISEYGVVENSALYGLSFTATKPVVFIGQYGLMSGDATASGNGWSKNSNQLTTGITGITLAHIRGYASNSAVPSELFTLPTTCITELAVGDVIRPHASKVVPQTASNCFLNFVVMPTTASLLAAIPVNNTAIFSWVENDTAITPLTGENIITLNEEESAAGFASLSANKVTIAKGKYRLTWNTTVGAYNGYWLGNGFIKNLTTSEHLGSMSIYQGCPSAVFYCFSPISGTAVVNLTEATDFNLVVERTGGSLSGIRVGYDTANAAFDRKAEFTVTKIK